MVGTIGKKLSKLVLTFYTLLRVLVTWSGSNIACIGTTNLAITLSFILDVKVPASRAD